MSILRADGQPLLDCVEKVKDHWKRQFAGFLVGSLLERREGGCLPAFVIGRILQSCPEIFNRPKGDNARRIGFFGNELDPLLKEGEGVICHVRLGAYEVRGR